MAAAAGGELDFLFHVWNRIEGKAVGESLGYEGAPGVVLTVRREGVEFSSPADGVKITNSWDAARCLLGLLPFGQMKKQREYAHDLGGGRVITAWVEEDRFVAPCECRPLPRPESSSIGVGGEDDCPVHGFGDGGEE